MAPLPSGDTQFCTGTKCDHYLEELLISRQDFLVGGLQFSVSSTSISIINLFELFLEHTQTTQ